MKTLTNKFALLALCCVIPVLCIAGDGHNDHIGTEVTIISVSEFILLITSLISIRQFFFKDEFNHSAFQKFNLFFAIAFYTISLTYLVHHKSYWEGFENLGNAECIKRVLLSTEPFALVKKLIWVAVVLNIVYIFRWGNEYDLTM